MARMRVEKRRVLALFLALAVTLLQAIAAQDDTGSAGFGNYESDLAAFEEIEAVLLLERRSCQAPTTKGRSRRFISPIDVDVLARGGNTEFTAIFTFPTVNDIPPQTFSAHPRALLASENAWYTEAQNGTRVVYAALKVPEDCAKTHCLPDAVIDVVCDECDAERATLAYAPPREEWRTISKISNLEAFRRRAPRILKNKPKVEEAKTCSAAGMRCWEFATSARAMCSGAFDAALTFQVKPANGSESFYWLSDTQSTRYTAKVGALNEFRVVGWEREDKRNFCQARTEKITLQMVCDGCSVDVKSAVLEKPTKPEVPGYFLPTPLAQLNASPGEREGSCDISATLTKGTTSTVVESDVVRLWYTSGVPDCVEPDSGAGSEDGPLLDWLERRRRVTQWEAAMNLGVSYLSWTLEPSTQCLCTHLTGLIYRPVKWEADERKARGNGNSCFYNKPRPATGGASSVGPAATGFGGAAETPQLRHTPPARKDYSLMLPPALDCESCVENVTLDAATVFDFVGTQPLKRATGSILPEKETQTSWRLVSRVPDPIWALGLNYKFTGVFEFPSRNKEKSGEFAARPLTFLTEEKAWNIEDGADGARWVYAALQLPEKVVASTPFEIVIDIVCDNCDIDQAKLFYLPAREEWRSVKRRANWDAFWNRSPQLVNVKVNATEKTPCSAAGMRCWEFNSTASALCNTAFDAALTFHVVPGNSTETYYWLSSAYGEHYQAEVGVIGWMRTVRWYPEDRWNFCRSPTETISLQMVCDACKISESGVETYSPERPEVPWDVNPTPLISLGPVDWTKEDGICSIEALLEDTTPMPTVTVDDVLRLWVISDRSVCLGPNETTAPQLSPSDRLRERKLVATWEKEIFQDMTKRVWRVSGTSRCLCWQLRGAIYRTIDWKPQNQNEDVSRVRASQDNIDRKDGVLPPSPSSLAHDVSDKM